MSAECRVQNRPPLIAGGVAEGDGGVRAECRIINKGGLYVRNREKKAF